MISYRLAARRCRTGARDDRERGWRYDRAARPAPNSTASITCPWNLLATGDQAVSRRWTRRAAAAGGAPGGGGGAVRAGCRADSLRDSIRAPRNQRARPTRRAARLRRLVELAEAAARQAAGAVAAAVVAGAAAFGRGNAPGRRDRRLSCRARCGRDEAGAGASRGSRRRRVMCRSWRR